MFLVILIAVTVICGIVGGIILYRGSLDYEEMGGALIYIAGVLLIPVFIFGTIGIIENAMPEQRKAEYLMKADYYQQIIDSKESLIQQMDLYDDILDFNSEVMKGKLRTDNLWWGFLYGDFYDDIPLVDINKTGVAEE